MQLPGPAASADGPMVVSVRAELERCRASGSVAGAIALRLAAVLDDPALGAPQVSTISQQLLRTLEPLQRNAPRDPDRLDDLAARVAAKVADAAD